MYALMFIPLLKLGSLETNPEWHQLGLNKSMRPSHVPFCIWWNQKTKNGKNMWPNIGPYHYANPHLFHLNELGNLYIRQKLFPECIILRIISTIIRDHKIKCQPVMYNTANPKIKYWISILHCELISTLSNKYYDRQSSFCFSTIKCL